MKLYMNGLGNLKKIFSVEILRHVRCSFNARPPSVYGALYDLYDPTSGTCAVPAFPFQSFSWLAGWIYASNKDILENMSTSPAVKNRYDLRTMKRHLILTFF